MMDYKEKIVEMLERLSEKQLKMIFYMLKEILR